MSTNLESTGAAPARTPSATRLAWLDALRGIAALMVAFHHFSLLKLIPGGSRFARHFDLGVFGVFLFFIISGWIIPASLERRRDVRRFWIGRIFRIYPLVCAVVALAWLMPAGYSPLKHQIKFDLEWSLVANGTLLHDFLGVRSAISVLWTLGFEMIFYYLTTALFLRGRERTSGVPLVFAALSLVGGVSTASAWLTTTWHSWFTRHVLISATVATTVLGLALLMSSRAVHRRLGADALAAMGLGLLLLNARAPMYECGAILATMFAGTVFFRVRAGQLAARLGYPIVAIVVLACALAGLQFNHPPRSQQTWTSTPDAYVFPFLAAWLLFVLGVVFSSRTWPAPLAWLGRVSYSVYIIHVPLMWFVFWFKDTYTALPRGHLSDCLIFGTDLVLLLLVSEGSYRWIEIPGQRLGARLARRLPALDDRRGASAAA